MHQLKRFAGLLCLLCVLSFVGWAGTRTYLGIQFERNVDGYLKLAADSNTVELAKDNLAAAIRYVREKGSTQGYTTALLWTTPDEDVGFWYKNLVASYQELGAVRPETTQLEKTNILMKLRETLLDQQKNGTSVTVPTGISVHPHNTKFFWWAVLSLIGGVIFFFTAAD